MKGSDRLKKDFEALRQLRHGLCTHIHRVNGQDKDLSALERGMIIGARRPGLSMLRTTTLQGFSHSTVSGVYQEWSTTRRTSSQLDTTVGSIGVSWSSVPMERFQHLVESMPQQIETVLRSKWRVKLNIRKVFLMFGIFSGHNWWLMCLIQYTFQTH
jgi:hypothetical protein